MAVKFAAAYGCDVTAFTSSESKFDEAKDFGANHVVSSKDSAAIGKLASSFDLLISTVNAKLDWDALIGTLAPNGRLHLVGAVLEPIPVAAFSLIMQQRSVSGSPIGSPVAIKTMLDFASRHNVAPQTEHFPMSKINEAFGRLGSGKARYRMSTSRNSCARSGPSSERSAAGWSAWWSRRSSSPCSGCSLRQVFVTGVPTGTLALLSRSGRAARP
jgi:uncharacterized zinc-type alcohol dehydrogenase-like protein